jgi:hypothetical protein
MNNVTLNGFSRPSIAYSESMGLSLCFEQYANIGEDIMEIGFNQYSGYVYIALENGIQICSCMGQEVEFLVVDIENGEETFFDSYEDAEQFMNQLN